MLPRRSADVFFTEEKVGALDISMLAELERIKKFFSSTKTEAPTEKKRSQNPGFRRGKKEKKKKADFSIVSQVPLNDVT